MAELLYPEGFYETTLAADLSASATTVSLSTVPSDVTKGYLIIEPASATKREVVYFSSVGAASVTTTDDTTDTGDATGRGCKGSVTVGANTSHDQGVTVIIANSYQYIKRIYDALAKVVIASSGDAGFTLGSDADGDIYYRASGKLARLAKGTASQQLRMNSGATAPEWVAGASATETLTNKRIEPRIVTAASYTTDTGTSLDVSTCDVFQVTAQAGALKFNNPGGTPVAGQKLIIRIKDDGTARALTYDTQFRASSDLALPTTTVLGKTLYMGFIYNATETKWDMVACLNNI